ncbi:hypothetical protein BG006_000944 [Podila minutissima]|uniref:Uncharacterized protein n=1 Tax=Podila minutissima TaxID=64525 RepID=A0A9P5SAU8_9FUNG|nr:hypothetical protein BG006_000944 [Podila minutissima]
MLSNKTFSLFAIAAIALMLLANVEAAPAKASLEDRITCRICDEPLECNLRCPAVTATSLLHLPCRMQEG